MAILLKRKKKAIAVAMIVWRPRNGEKAIKTPIENASAVRSGGSSIASRRRNAARNIIKGRRFYLLTLMLIRVHPRKSAAKILLLKALQRLRLIVVRVKDGQQFCNHQQILNTV